MGFMKNCSPLAIKPQVLRAVKSAPSAAALTIETFPVLGDSLFLCLGCAVFDYDHLVPTYIEIGVKDGTAFIPVRCQSGAFPAKTSMNIEYPFLVTPGQKIYSIINNPHEKDNVELIAHGVMIRKDVYEARTFSLSRYRGRRRNYYGWR